MTVTVLWEDREATAAGAQAEGDALWLPAEQLQAVSGWALKPEGACRDEICVPLPAGREAEFLRDGGREFNLEALARLLGQPEVHEQAQAVWAFGEAAAARRDSLRSLEAPDFALPDLEGRVHRLSDYRGRKVFLVSWASW